MKELDVLYKNKIVEQAVERFTPIARKAMFKAASELNGDEKIALAFAAGAKIKIVHDEEGYANARFVSVYPLGFINDPITGKVQVIEKAPKEEAQRPTLILDQFGN